MLAVLAQLRHEHYGYTLKRALAAMGLIVEEGTLYPLLRRLETHGLLVSEWRQEDSRDKRFYRLSDDGRLTVERLRTEWLDLNAALTRILEA